ncbi:MAG: hypothetical protein WCH44_09130, partial [Betaproteobacteria bacterium]
NGSFTSSFFCETLLARVMLCYLYSIFFIVESQNPAVATLWRSLSLNDCRVVDVFQRNVFGSCNKKLLSYIKKCISKAFTEDAGLSLQTYVVGIINTNKKATRYKVVLTCPTNHIIGLP